MWHITVLPATQHKWICPT